MAISTLGIKWTISVMIKLLPLFTIAQPNSPQIQHLVLGLTVKLSSAQSMSISTQDALKIQIQILFL